MSALAVEARPRHVKCGSELTQVRGEYGPEWYCRRCFATVELPSVTPEEAAREQELPEGKLRARPAHLPSPAWTEQERRVWATWKEGDPVPGEEEKVTDPDEGFKTLDTRGLGARCLEQLRYLAEQQALLDMKAAKIAEEALKVARIAEYCGVRVPDELKALAKAKPGPKPKSKAKTELSGDYACSCGRTFPTPFSRAAHTRRDPDGHSAVERGPA